MARLSRRLRGGTRLKTTAKEATEFNRWLALIYFQLTVYPGQHTQKFTYWGSVNWQKVTINCLLSNLPRI